MPKTLVVDQEECIGCESCVEICPEVFGFDDKRCKAFVLQDEDVPEEKLQEAMQTCPVSCIYWE